MSGPSGHSHCVAASQTKASVRRPLDDEGGDDDDDEGEEASDRMCFGWMSLPGCNSVGASCRVL